MDEKIRLHLGNYLKGLHRERVGMQKQLQALEEEIASVTEILRKGGTVESSK
jgi:hypothetical protein